MPHTIPMRAVILPVAYGLGLRAGREWAYEQATFAELSQIDAERYCQEEVDAPFLAGFLAGCLQVWDESNSPVA